MYVTYGTYNFELVVHDHDNFLDTFETQVRFNSNEEMPSTFLPFDSTAFFEGLVAMVAIIRKRK
ncbi:MAG: hypothetical protein INQ03_20040 [Candidatus Heimdallarchaeota archaeon]|nr:hypothetical protein [Candidatus Heimdallarchaeota archaeon]